MNVVVLVASIRQGRVGRAVGDWVVAAARQQPGLDVSLVDLAELQLPLHEEPHHPRLQNYVGEPAKQWSAIAAAADAFVIVMPEYNHSFSAPLKNALDYLHHEWIGKPVGLVSYGGLSGGTRAVVALQPVLVNLGLVCLRANVEIAWVSEHIEASAFVATERHDRAVAGLLAELGSVQKQEPAQKQESVQKHEPAQKHG